MLSGLRRAEFVGVVVLDDANACVLADVRKVKFWSDALLVADTLK